MCFFSLDDVCSFVPFCTRPVYFRVVLFSAPFFGLFIKFAFYRSKNIYIYMKNLRDTEDWLGIELSNSN